MNNCLTDYEIKFQGSLVKDPAVSVNRVIWSPDGSLFGKLICYYLNPWILKTDVVLSSFSIKVFFKYFV